MQIGVIADDFTGAGDIASMFARRDRRTGAISTHIHVGIPEDQSDPEAEVGVIALKTRSVPAPEAVSQSLRSLDWLLAQGCRQIVFKYCSTFDSTSEGNIGPVGEALARRLGVRGVVACPAYPSLGRTVYQGHLFVHDRLLSQSGMERHPVTPMTDPDIRRWLSRQSQDPVGHVGLKTVALGPESIRTELSASAERGETLVIVDAISDDDLERIGEACSDAPLITGGAGIARGLALRPFSGRNRGEGAAPARDLDGPEAILVGSCSRASLIQIAAHARSHPVMRISIDELMRGTLREEDVLAFLAENRGLGPLVCSSADANDVRAAQKKYGAGVVSDALDRFFGRIARAAVDRGVTRLVVGGGESSGAVVSALGLSCLAVGDEITAGVPVLYAKGPRPLALALKSGNFGEDDFFARALSRMAGG